MYKSPSLCQCHAGYTAYCGVSVYAAQKGDDKEDEEVSSVPVLLKAGLSLETQWAFMQLGISGGFMMAAEASSYDVTTALAGLLGAALRLHCPCAGLNACNAHCKELEGHSSCLIYSRHRKILSSLRRVYTSCNCAAHLQLTIHKWDSH